MKNLVLERNKKILITYISFSHLVTIPIILNAEQWIEVTHGHGLLHRKPICDFLQSLSRTRAGLTTRGPSPLPIVWQSGSVPHDGAVAPTHAPLCVCIVKLSNTGKAESGSRFCRRPQNALFCIYVIDLSSSNSVPCHICRARPTFLRCPPQKK